MSDSPGQPAPAPPPADAPLGADGELIRALTFSGGAFDTTMQLGVVHALLVIQGKAPDAVVGVSAGAVHAAALAEVIQAGEELESEGWPDDPAARAELQRNRMRARIARFREILDALHRAPERLVDGLLPDAYQIDSLRPLRPVEMPVFHKRERDRRKEALASRSGLVKLYNDLLGLRIKFGTTTRAVRRILGFSAAAEVRHWTGRLLVRALEIARLWILIGNQLFAVAPLLRILIMPWLARSHEQEGDTAGGIIFRFKFVSALGRGIVRWTWFLLVFAVWFWVTYSVLLFPHQVAVLVDQDRGGHWVPTLMSYAFFLSLLAGAVFYTLPSVLEFERISRVRVPRMVFHAFFAVIIPATVWGAVLVLVTLAWNVLLWPGPPSWAEATDRTWGFLHLLIDDEASIRVQLLVVSIAVAAGVVLSMRKPGRKPLRRLLKRYGISESIFHPYPLERYLAQVFDPGYDGERDMDAVVDRSLADIVSASEPAERSRDGRKYVGHYASPDRREPIHVGLGVADIDSGRLETVGDNVTVVDGLVAAMAMTPLFPPKQIDGTLYVDGANVSNEPMEALLSMLRGRVHPTARTIHVYHAAPVPLSLGYLPRAGARAAEGSNEEERPALDLIEVTVRALRLRRFRDATLERRLTHLYSKVLPEGSASTTVEGFDDPFVRAWITPIEPEEPIDLNPRIAGASKEDRRRMVEETIADGCRASLQVMVGPSQELTWDSKDKARKPLPVRCRTAVDAHLRSREEADPTLAHLEIGLHERETGQPDRRERPPGLPEICKRCALWRDPDPTRGGRRARTKARRRPLPQYPTARIAAPRQHLQFRDLKASGPPWPHERETGTEADLAARGRFLPPEGEKDPLDLPEGWPAERPHPLRVQKVEGSEAGADCAEGKDKLPGADRPLVNLLFSGGVFRGVFQMGVVNALSELNVQPDLIAGASVGSITGAMTAEVFSHTEPESRRLPVARLAAVYLALDRLVLTDRFADFIRNLTIRAADANFSLHQADRVFRRFDAPFQYERKARIVLAGLERLFYVSPFEVSELVQAIRDRDHEKVSNRLRGHAQEWLDRMEVGDEILGAEPLELLIREYVTEHLEAVAPQLGPTLDDLRRRSDVHFLATATNLTGGRLEIVGRKAMHHGVPGPQRTRIDQSLLASSAFPAVFRPRWSHELFPGLIEDHQYIDGGVMDNLPVDAVAEFMHAAARENRIERRPQLVLSPGQAPTPTPHLVFAASLEPRVRLRERVKRSKRDRWLESWPELMKRARELGYNRKLDKYQRTQQRLREIFRRHPGDWVPLDLELVVVKPEWLCGTFAFHPMLGFRRENQARSIAHGCASTFLEFARVREANPSLPLAWGMSESDIPSHTDFETARSNWRTVKERRKKARAGACWLRPERRCPFSDDALKALDLPKGTRDSLKQIHELCLKSDTHRAD